jgi:hypothetical protein
MRRGHLSKEGQLFTKPLPTYKAHNLILDTTCSLGILGILSYLALFGFCLRRTIKSPYRGIEAIAIAYLAFTFTWFECAQFTHLAWWALCFTQISPEKRSNGSIQQPVPQQAMLHPKDVITREMSA